jgi:two-component system, OmpR family, sensor histidine kinase KdpD
MIEPSQKPKISLAAKPTDLLFTTVKALSNKEILQKYFRSFLIVVAITFPGFWLRQTLDTATIAMFYLLAPVGIAVWLGRGPAIAASFLGVLALDYFITPPYFSFTVARPESWMTLFVMLVESLVISTLATKSRQAEKHRTAAENEKNRSALLSAVSHDLRTPLTSIIGAASGLLEDKGGLSSEERFLLTQSIYDEAERLKHLVQNLLDMTRLEAGAVEPKKEWQSIEELVGVALDRLKPRLLDHPLHLDFQSGLSLAFIDGLLVEQLLLNLLENALNHTPPGTSIQLSVRASEGGLEVEVADRGPGLKPGEEKTIFEKFIRGYHSSGKGAGLGLSICSAIARAHGGNIVAGNRPGGGASFRVLLPIGGTPPTVQEE